MVMTSRRRDYVTRWAFPTNSIWNQPAKQFVRHVQPNLTEDQMTKSAALYVAGISQHFGSAPGATTEIIVIGIVATLVTDIWQRLLQAIAGLPPARWGLIGRWVVGFPAASSHINRSRWPPASAAKPQSVGHSTIR